jgi:hypothetical protein
MKYVSDAPAYPKTGLCKGSLNAVVAPESILIDMIRGSPILRDRLVLVVGSGNSAILPGIIRTAASCEVKRVLFAHQLYLCLKKEWSPARPLAVLIEPDPALFDGACDMIGIVREALDELSHTTRVVLYPPVLDRVFCALIHPAELPIWGNWNPGGYAL